MQIVTVALLGCATALMIAPTYPAVWGVQAGDGTPGTTTTYHSWADPLLLGYGHWNGLLALICTAVATGIAVYLLVQKRPQIQVTVWAVMGTVIALIGALIFRLPMSWAWVAIAAAAAGAVTGWLAARPAKELHPAATPNDPLPPATH